MEQGVDGLDAVSLSRRQLLGGLTTGGLAIGSGMAVNNVALGYGIISGTNLLEQDVASLAASGFRSYPFTIRVADTEITHIPDELIVRDLTDPTDAVQLQIEPGVRDTARDIDDEHSLDGILTELATDILAITNGNYSFEFYTITEFFAELSDAQTRGYSTHAVRGLPSADPRLVHEFTDEPPSDTQATITGLVTGFREHTHYDLPRYAAGSIQDNVIFGVKNLRAPFETTTGYETLLGDESIGLFCYDFTDRSIEALHAVPAFHQSIPVVGARVRDARHKHVYTGVASLIREGDKLKVPMTFVDYTHTTIYDDFRLRRVLGEGLNAYNARHRSTLIQWIR